MMLKATLLAVSLLATSSFSYSSMDGLINIEFRSGMRVAGFVHPTPDGPLKVIRQTDNPLLRFK
jgi:hypothetical protein